MHSLQNAVLHLLCPTYKLVEWALRYNFASNSISFYSVGVQNQSVDSPFIYVPAGAVLVEADFYSCGPVPPLVCPLSHPDCCALQDRAAFGQPRMLGPAPRVDVRNVKSLVRWLEIVWILQCKHVPNSQGLARKSWRGIRVRLLQSLDIIWKFPVKLVLVLSQIMFACWPLLSN